MKYEDTYAGQRELLTQEYEEQQRNINAIIAAQSLLVRPFVWLYFKAQTWRLDRNMRKIRDGPR